MNRQVFPLAVCVMLFAGCSTAKFKADADKEAYEIIRQKERIVMGVERPFSIDRESGDPLLGLPLVRPEPLGNLEGEDAVLLSLAQAVEIATANNREYQSRMEDVYLGALDLSLARSRWAPIFSGNLSTTYTNAPGTETVSGQGNAGLSWLLPDGTQLGLKISTDYLLKLIGSPREAAASLITATLTKPLWRGAGKRIAQENLLQAERDMVYRIRTFARYRRTFAITVASQYYRVLQQRDSVMNAWNNYQNLIVGRERSEMLAEAGRLPGFEVDQARQSELSAQDRYVRAIQSYQQSLDQLKIRLGLPTDAAIQLDPADITSMRDQGIIHPDLNFEDAIDIALAARLDLANTLDQVADAARKVEVAENGLVPDVQLVLSSSVPTSDSNNNPLDFRPNDARYSAGLDVEIPFDRKQERNTYRRTLISFDRSKRDASLAIDNVKLEVRDAWRKLEEARASYEIQRISLELAEKRVRSTTLLLDAGRASTRDLLEAQDSLLEAQNSLTRTIVDHTIARLEFWRDIGILEIDEKGLWQEDFETFTNGQENEFPENNVQ